MFAGVDERVNDDMAANVPNVDREREQPYQTFMFRKMLVCPTANHGLKGLGHWE